MVQAPALATAAPTERRGGLRLVLGMALIVLIAEWVGPIAVPLPVGAVTLLPLLWALLLGAGWGIASGTLRLPAMLSLPPALQARASHLLQFALMLFVAKLGLMVGISVPRVLESGTGLIFQEFGHFLGTMVFGMPIALLLGIKREAIGATFSVGREPSLAIIAERFGMQSPEGRGVLAEYLTGTVFGAVFIAVLASILTALNVFDPIAMAMGSGVGSGSMMAAAAGAIAAQQPQEVAKDIAAFAAASNIITTTVGTWFTLFISLPTTLFAYRVLEPILGRRTKASVDTSPDDLDAPNFDEGGDIGPLAICLCWLACAAMAVIANALNYKGVVDAPTFAAAGITVLIALVSVTLARLLPVKIPVVLWCSVFGMAATYPAFPWAAAMEEVTDKLNFMALSAPILAFAGLSLAKDIPAFRRLGWRIVVVSLFANAGTFIGATMIAQFFEHRPV
ncbi:DUF3100 domain-containing protein [Novosphingobium sp. BL-52-GroH]|uniref:DUF3100 domain-containing protein n=1 Tax=Novosphingobium sp. BL-52-GroH TaxID=3349877 RepID=UPI00384D4E41